jgi:glucosamine--fructose-6-phosphate aminotransferase (isomerizing)
MTGGTGRATAPTTEPTAEPAAAGPTPAGFLADVEAAPARLADLAAVLRKGSPWPAAVTRAERILLLGMGSSRYAAEAAALRLRASGLTAVAEPASVAATWPPRPDTAVVAVSASGRSAETLAAAERYAGAGLVALTEDLDSPLAELAGAAVPMLAGRETGGVACRSYRHTLALLLALRPEDLGGSLGSGGLADVVDRAAESTADLLDRRGDWLADVADRLDGPDGVAVLAPAERRCSADQSALMIREGPRRQATASETGDWSHVDVYLAKTLDYRALLLPGSAWEAAAMAWLTRRGSTVVPVGAPVEGAGPPVRYRHDDDPGVRLLAEVTVAELVAARWWSPATEENT